MRNALCGLVIAALLLSSGCRGLIIGSGSKRTHTSHNAKRTPIVHIKGKPKLLVVCFCEDADKPMLQYLEIQFPGTRSWNQISFQGEELLVRNNGDYVKLVSGSGIVRYGDVDIAVNGRDVAIDGAFLPPSTRLMAIQPDGSITPVEEPEPKLPLREG